MKRILVGALVASVISTVAVAQQAPAMPALVPAPDMERVINFLAAEHSDLAMVIRQQLLTAYLAAQKPASAPAPAAPPASPPPTP